MKNRRLLPSAGVGEDVSPPEDAQFSGGRMGNLSGRLLRVAVAALVGVGSAFAVGGSANAAGWPQCPAGRACLFEHADGQGGILILDTSSDQTYDLKWYNFDQTSTNVNDRVSSAYLTPRLAGKCVYFYEHDNRGGRKVGLYTSGTVDLRTFGLNDQVSSLAVRTC